MNSVVFVIIAINALVSFKGFSDRLFIERYKFQVGPVLQGDYIRMLSSGFLHVDQTHLIFNMFSLFIFAPVVVVQVGVLKFLAIYFGSLLAGNTLALSFHKREPYYSAVGASGAVMGIVYAAIMLNPGMRLSFFLLPILSFPAYLFGLGYFLYSIYGMKTQLGNIGHSAHLGGAIGGFVLTLVLYPQIVEQNKMVILILAFPILLMFIFKNKLERP